jgi:hypothetical protein
MPARPIRAAGKASKRKSMRKNKKTKSNMKTKHRGGNPERTYTNSKTGASYTRPHRTVPQSDSTENYTEHPGVPSMPASGGAVYSFDLNDKIGGLPANVSLNGTQDGDCPSTGALDLGFTNYGLTKGGSYKKNKKNHKKNRNTKTKKNKNKNKKSSKSKSRSRKN